MKIFVGIVTLLIFYFNFSFGANNVGVNDTKILWPSSYHLKGEDIYVMGGVTEPFEIWYRKSSRRSRKDLYAGLVKHYYSNSILGPYTIIIHSETNSEGEVVRRCRNVVEKKKELKSLLPPVEGFVYKGHVNYDSRFLQLWEAEKVNKSEDVLRKYSLYAYKMDKFHVPVRYDYKKYSLSTQGLTMNRVTLYYNFNSTVSKDDVNVKKSPDGAKCLSLQSASEIPSERDDFDIGTSFHGFKYLHNKKYDHTEHDLRKTIFEDNLRYIEEHNRKGLGYTLKATSFADRSDEELRSTGCILPLGNREFDSEYYSFKNEELDAMTDDLPEELDLRIKGIVNPIRNQLLCGSCWTFSTTGTVEGALAMKNGGKLLDLSEQSLVDCAWDYENYGCRGGFLDHAFKYILDHGIPTEREYGSYLMEEGNCHINNMTEVYKIRGFGRVTVGSAPALKAALNKYGPVAVSLYAGKNMLLYSSGIFYDPTCNDHRRNHAVIVVGYGTRNGTPYWLVRNSWGESWGEGGYILLSAKDNNCHVLNEMYYAVV